jgi:hypothetical protein
MDAREAFLAQHALLHSKSVAPDGMFSYQDRLVEDLGDDQLRTAPPGLNSIVWALWHLSRYEDLVVNAVLRCEPEVFDGGWATRLGADTGHAGTGFGDDEVSSMSESIDIAALLDYRADVGRGTRQWLAGLDPTSLDGRPDIDAITAGATKAGVRASWVLDFWKGKTIGELLIVPVLAHGFNHIGEAFVTRSLLGGANR